MIAEIWEEVQAETLYLPLHHQVLNWGFSEGVDSDVSVEDQPKFKYFEIQRS
jgi:peptide/nickel transport system substrate-binding protein